MDLFEIIEKPQNFPYCPGCGHTLVNMALAKAIVSLNIPKENILIVSDIGCVGLVDKLFNVHTVHTLHGRSTAIGTGIKMADEILFNNNLKTIVMIGDGGATIGLLHLVEAAKMNVDITVLIHNNFLYGMTGGQHSGLTPQNFITSTTRKGNPFPALNIIEILKNAGASFYARTFVQDRELSDIIKEAIVHKGFSVIEIFELCTGYAARYNKLKGSDLKNILEKHGGKIKEKKERLSFGESYEESIKGEEGGYELKVIEKEFEIPFNKSQKIIIAGSAGEGVQFASSLLALSALICGLNSSQKNDNPVTVGSGFSISEIIISKEKIRYSGIENPDYLIITSMDGYKRVKGKIMKAKNVIIDETLSDESKFLRVPARKYKGERGGPTVFSLGVLFEKYKIFPPEVFLKTVEKYGKSKEKTIKIFEEGRKFALKG